MFPVQGLAVDHLRDVPGFKALLKAVLKSQIQLLVEQLALHTDEESIVLSASVSDGALSYLGSEQAKDFLEQQEDIKSQFLRFCLEKHHQKLFKAKDLACQSLLTTMRQDSPSENHRFQGPSGTRSNHRKAVHSAPVKRRMKHTRHEGNNKAAKIPHTESHFDVHKPSTYSPHEELSNQDIASVSQLDRSGITEHAGGLDVQYDMQHNGHSKEDERLNSDCQTVIVKTEPVMDEEDETEQSVPVGNVQQDAFGGGHPVVFPPRPGYNLMDWSLGQNNQSSTASPHSMLEEGQSYQQLGSQSFADIDPMGILFEHKPLNMSMSAQRKLGKKRVYRKVECEFCNKMVYITNIKVHRYRHMQQQHEPKKLSTSGDITLS